MAFLDFIDALRGMILAQGANDDGGFRRDVERVIKALTIQNRPAEAKILKEALRKPRIPSETQNQRPLQPLQSMPPSLVAIGSQTSDLISMVRTDLGQTLVFGESTQNALDDIVREYGGMRKLAEAGLSPRNRLLFWGPPGCGKTAAARWLGATLGLPCGVVRLGTLITSYVGETGANVQRVLLAAERLPMVLLLDEADAIAKTRDDENDVGELRRVVNVLLQGLDAFSTSKSILILASNHTQLFDPAVWRRFDDIIAFPPPGERERLKLLKALTSGFRIKGSLIAVAKELEGSSFADIEKAVMDVARNVVMSGNRTIAAECIISASVSWRRKTAAATATAPKTLRKK